jgi:DNA-binding transcriptional ArsR family regulator
LVLAHSQTPLPHESSPARVSGGGRFTRLPEPHSAAPITAVAYRSWTFLTNHGHVLLAVARNPEATITEIEAAAEISRRSTFRILADLQKAGYVTRIRHGRSNRYELNRTLPLEDPLVDQEPLSELIALLPGMPNVRRRAANTPEANGTGDESGTLRARSERSR